MCLTGLMWVSNCLHGRPAAQAQGDKATIYIQLGQLSVIPPGLVLEAGGDFNLAGSYACKVEVPPHFKVPSGGDFSSPGMAAC